MDWQSGLARLEQQLAAGDITSAEYRNRRDELLAQASSTAQLTERQNEFAARTQRHPVPPVLDLSGTAGDSDKTMPAQPATASPEWRNGPNPAASTEDWAPRQTITPSDPRIDGDTVFAAARPARRGRVLLVIGVLVVVAVLVIGAVLWFGKSDPDPTPAANQPPPPGPAPAISLDSLPNPTSVSLTTVGVMSVPQADAAKVIQPDEVAGLTKVGTDKIYLRAVVDGGFTYQISAVVARDRDGLLSAFAEHQGKVGLKPVKLDGLPDGVRVQMLSAPSATIYEADYRMATGAVRIVVAQAVPPKQQKAEPALRHVVQLALTSIPQA